MVVEAGDSGIFDEVSGVVISFTTESRPPASTNSGDERRIRSEGGREEAFLSPSLL